MRSERPGRAPGRRLPVVGLLALAFGVAAAGCGTTVPVAEQSRGLSVEQDGSLLQPGESTLQLPEEGIGQPAAGVTGSQSQDQRPGATPTGGSTGAISGGTPAPVGGGKQGSLPPIRIGALTANGAGEFQKSLGFNGAVGDQLAMTRSVVRYLNDRGGIGGRKIEVVFYDVRMEEAATDPSASEQAACAFFTQDARVQAVASILSGLSESFYACLEKRGVPTVVPAELTSHRFFEKHASSVYMPSSPTYTRLLSASVDVLWDRGWLTGTSKVGVVGVDTPDARATVDEGLVPALKRHGLTLTDVMYTATDTSQAGEYPGGVLRFASKGIDRVFFAPGGQPIYFALAAENQQYRPRYELGSLEYPYLLTQNLPAAQLAGSAGLGWMPTFDVAPAQWRSVTTPGLARCKEAVKSAQQDLSNGTVLGIAAWVCDNWFLLRDALQRTSVVSLPAVRQAVESLGRGFSPAATFATRFGPGLPHDGGVGYRLNVFTDSCQCFTYATGVRPFP